MFGPSDKRFVSFHFIPRFYSGYYKLPGLDRKVSNYEAARDDEF